MIKIKIKIKIKSTRKGKEGKMNKNDEVEKFKDIFAKHKDFFMKQPVTFLLGAGCSVGAGLPLMSKLTDDVVSCLKDEKIFDLIEKSFSQQNNGKITIEDYMSDIANYISIAERHDKGFQVPLGKTGEVADIKELKDALSRIKKEILDNIHESQKGAMKGGYSKKLANHMKFVEMMNSIKDRKVDYSILNYDTLIETALGLNKVKYTDGFSSGPIGSLGKDAFEKSKINTCVHKLHGSIDWFLLGNEPRRIDPNHYLVSKGDDILIYPSVKKTTEVYRDPFIEKLIDFRKALRENDSLIICGYGFGDSHINLEIEEALKSNELKTLIIFVDEYKEGEEDCKSEVICKWFGCVDNGEKVSVYSENGFFQKDRNLVKNLNEYEDCYKFERIVELLRGVSG